MPPTPTPTPTATPTATATPRPTPTATPTATATPPPAPTATPEALSPAELVGRVEAVPGAFERREFAPGERIDWTSGILFMDTETGRIEGYRYVLTDIAPVPFAPSRHAAHGVGSRWVTAPSDEAWFVFDRDGERAWRLPSGVTLAAASGDRVVLATAAGEGVLTDGDFSAATPIGPVGEDAMFSPDGRKLLVRREHAVYLLDLDTLDTETLFEPEPHDEWGSPGRVWHEATRAGNEILVTVQYQVPISESQAGSAQSDYPRYTYPKRWLRFGWDGAALAEAASPEIGWRASQSPDGRFVAWEDDGYSPGLYEVGRAWPSVVVADSATREPLFRVLSASLQSPRGDDWLDSSDGVLLRTFNEKYIGWWSVPVLLRIRPSPVIEWFPDAPAGYPRWPFSSGALASPDGQRFIAESRKRLTDDPGGDGVTIYDTHLDRWWVVSGPLNANWYLRPSWPPPGASRQELVITPTPIHPTGGGGDLFTRPKIEFPPFSEEVAFRVSGGGGCVSLLERPRARAAELECLPDGARVVLAVPPEPPSDRDGGALTFIRDGGGLAVRVRTADGVEGWVAHAYLDHD